MACATRCLASCKFDHEACMLTMLVFQLVVGLCVTTQFHAYNFLVTVFYLIESVIFWTLLEILYMMRSYFEYPCAVVHVLAIVLSVVICMMTYLFDDLYLLTYFYFSATILILLMFIKHCCGLNIGCCHFRYDSYHNINANNISLVGIVFMVKFISYGAIGYAICETASDFYWFILNWSDEAISVYDYLWIALDGLFLLESIVNNLLLAKYGHFQSTTALISRIKTLKAIDNDNMSLNDKSESLLSSKDIERLRIEEMSTDVWLLDDKNKNTDTHHPNSYNLEIRSSQKKGKNIMIDCQNFISKRMEALDLKLVKKLGVDSQTLVIIINSLLTMITTAIILIISELDSTGKSCTKWKNANKHSKGRELRTECAIRVATICVGFGILLIIFVKHIITKYNLDKTDGLDLELSVRRTQTLMQTSKAFITASSAAAEKYVYMYA